MNAKDLSISENSSYIVFISGGTKSGKSEFAEHLAKKVKKLSYVALSENNIDDKEWQEKIISHQKRRTKNWKLIGKTNLFHTYATSSSLEVEKQFAAHYIWIRTFDYSETWVRLGIPTSKYEWTRVRQALNQ